MKDKQFDPAGNNEKAPAEGMAAVNTHNPGEEPLEQLIKDELIQNNSAAKDVDRRDDTTK
ncbi:MAG: hypothetical protein ACJ749_04240 [Flavisolibacter sp.]